MILLTGANGQLGQDYQKLFTGLNIDSITTDYLELDITSINSVRSFVAGKSISYIINCAAYTEEDEPNPISVYADSKYQGEKAVLTVYCG